MPFKFLIYEYPPGCRGFAATLEHKDSFPDYVKLEAGYKLVRAWDVNQDGAKAFIHYAGILGIRGQAVALVDKVDPEGEWC